MIPVRVRMSDDNIRKGSWRYASTPRGVVKLTPETKSILLVDTFTLPISTPRLGAVYTSLLRDRVERHLLAILSCADQEKAEITGFEIEIKLLFISPMELDYYQGKGGGFPSLETLSVEYTVLGYVHNVYIKDPQALMIDRVLKTRDLSDKDEGGLNVGQQVMGFLCQPLMPPVDETRALCEELAKDPLRHPNEMQMALASAADLIRELQCRVEGLASPVCKI